MQNNCIISKGNIIKYCIVSIFYMIVIIIYAAKPIPFETLEIFFLLCFFPEILLFVLSIIVKLFNIREIRILNIIKILYNSLVIIYFVLLGILIYVLINID